MRRYRRFLDGLLDRMRTENRKVIMSLEEGGKLQYDRLASLPWEEEFRPLTYSEAVEVWHSTNGGAERDNSKNSEGSEEEEEDTLSALLHLHDRCWIMVDGVEASRPEHVFPSCLLQVVQRGMDRKPAEKMFNFLRGITIEFLKKVPEAALAEALKRVG